MDIQEFVSFCEKHDLLRFLITKDVEKIMDQFLRNGNLTDVVSLGKNPFIRKRFTENIHEATGFPTPSFFSPFPTFFLLATLFILFSP